MTHRTTTETLGGENARSSYVDTVVQKQSEEPNVTTPICNSADVERA